MFPGEGFVERSIDEMQAEMKELLAESERLKERSEETMRRSDDLRADSVDCRLSDPIKAETLWEKSDDLRSEARELLRLSVDKRLRASEIKHQLEIHAQIEAVTSEVDLIWKEAMAARRL